MKRFMLFALQFAPACATSEVLYVDARFTAAEQADIQAASDEWERATGSGVDLVFNADVSNKSYKRVMVRDASDADLDDHGRAQFANFPTVAGNTHIQHGPFGVTGERLDILMTRLPVDDNGVAVKGVFQVMVMHEFGHHLGLENMHSPVKGTLMNLRAGAACVTHDDAALWCQHFGCDPEGVRYCVPSVSE